jgi:RimJ/RimL family protein N-acetyltransferase
LLEGKNVNLRVVEKEDLPLLAEWFNNLEFWDGHEFPGQSSRTEMEKEDEKNPFEMKDFIIEKKDGSKIGLIYHYYMLHPDGKLLEIGYALVPNERGKGYCTEATKIMVDYLFLLKETMRVQAMTDVGNIASERVLEKAGFKREGTIRKAVFLRGEWVDLYLYSILREEWKEPKILTKTTSSN